MPKFGSGELAFYGSLVLNGTIEEVGRGASGVSFEYSISFVGTTVNAEQKATPVHLALLLTLSFFLLGRLTSTISL